VACKIGKTGPTTARHASATAAEHNALLKVRAFVKHRLGEVLAETVKAGNPKLNCDTASQLPDKITRKQSSRAQQLARVAWGRCTERVQGQTIA
jgi:hypothetical protein